MVDADLGRLEQLWLIGAALQQPQAGGVLLGATGRIALHRKLIEGQAHFTVAAAVDQFQTATWGQELLQSMAPQGAPGGAEHQHHHAGMHQQRTHAPCQAPAGRQPIPMALDLPAPAPQRLLQESQAGGTIGHRHALGQAQFAQLTG